MPIPTQAVWAVGRKRAEHSPPQPVVLPPSQRGLSTAPARAAAASCKIRAGHGEAKRLGELQGVEVFVMIHSWLPYPNGGVSNICRNTSNATRQISQEPS